MASPFPGMDPYLEGEMWQEFHETLANAIRAQLMPRLRPKYVALLAKRYVLDRTSLGIIDAPPARTIYPDVHVVRPEARPVEALPIPNAPFAVPTLDLPSPTVEAVPQLGVEVRDVADRRLVTLIEILSPVNKRGEGAREYADRRMTLMQTAVHLLELDLLLQGQRLPLLGALPPAAYYVYLSRAERRPSTHVWALDLRQPLPVIPVPLLPPDADVALDLQAAVDACFDLVGYENLLNYSGAPPPGLSPDDTAWVRECLRAMDRG